MARAKRAQQGYSVREVVPPALEQSKQRVFMHKELREIFQKTQPLFRRSWNGTLSDFVEHLVEEKILRETAVEMPDGKRVTRYLVDEASMYEVALSLKGGSYLSHYSALFLHGLTDNIPKVVYTNLELPKTRQAAPQKLQQEAIDRAFANNMRHSNQIATCGEIKIYLLNSKNVDKIGVKDLPWNGVSLAVTEIERTLIDIAVRPDYAGGVQEVLQAYQTAKDKVSVNRLAALLQKIDYTYPYQQAIGFYLERSGYSDAAVKLLRKKEFEYDFYLTYKMVHPEYSEKWRLFYPKGF